MKNNTKPNRDITAEEPTTCKECENKVYKKGLCRGHFGVAVAKFVVQGEKPTTSTEWEGTCRSINNILYNFGFCLVGASVDMKLKEQHYEQIIGIVEGLIQKALTTRTNELFEEIGKIATDEHGRDGDHPSCDRDYCSVCNKLATLRQIIEDVKELIYEY